MGILGGLEQFGIKADEKMSLYEEPKAEAPAAKEGAEEKPEEAAKPQHSESEFLLEKSLRCPVCERVFKTLQPKSGRVKREESDKDLRPRAAGIDIMKYNVCCCPGCGYTALSSSKYFESVNPNQKKLIEEKVCKNFDPESVAAVYKPDVKEWDYDTAISLHKLSLYNAVVKGAKTSEKAYNCLVLSWLLRGKAETLEGIADQKDEYEAVKREEEEYYAEAYEGLYKAMSTENFPIAGMDQTTLEYLLATMSYKYGKTDVAAKLLASIIQSPVTTQKIKDKARDLKDEIVASIKASKQQQ